MKFLAFNFEDCQAGLSRIIAIASYVVKVVSYKLHSNKFCCFASICENGNCNACGNDELVVHTL